MKVSIYSVHDKKQGRTWHHVLAETSAGAAAAIGLRPCEAVVTKSDNKVPPFLLRFLEGKNQ
jgi:hypothetical protein